MEILLAPYSGFCFGVKRAIQIALEAANKPPVYTTGPLIHNPQMVQELEKKGIKVMENPDELHNSTVIIRSHGITKQENEILLRNGNTIIDATCPFVAKAHEYAQRLTQEHYPILILGDHTHPEVEALLSYCDGETIVISSPKELPEFQWQRLGVISQTTMDLASLREVINALIPCVKELRLFNTICTATSQRQEATVALAKKCDLMIVIGGHNSSNTRMLTKLSSEFTPTLQIETAAELKPEVIMGKQRIGISAGASTPDYLIVQVFNRIKEITGDRTTVKSVEDIPVNKEES